jgi:hypothetical protein
MNESVESLVAYCRENDRVCPLPQAQKLFYFFDKISYRRDTNLFRRCALSRWLSLRDDFTFCFRNAGTEMLACPLPSLELICTRLPEPHHGEQAMRPLKLSQIPS